MRGCKKGKLRVCRMLLPVLTLLVAMVVLQGCKKKEEYRNIRVTEVTGDVTVNRDGQTGLKAYVNMNLQSEDELITEEGAKVTLRLDDDKYVIVDEDSKLLLIAGGTEEDSATRIELEYGAVFSDIKDKLSENSEYEVVTPSAAMSVRGTQFEVVYRELKDEAGKLLEKVMKVLTFEGEVYVKPEGSKEKRVSKAGTMEVLEENTEGKYQFAGEAKKIEAEDLSELSASYLKEDLSESGSDLPEEEKAWKEELLEKVEEYFESVSLGKDAYNRAEHLYQCVALDGRSWEQINAYCEENGGHLATIMSAEENEYLYEQMVQWGFDFAYFGYTDEVTEGEWNWVTGEKASYENWYADDVDNFREEDYAMLWTTRPYFWNDGGLRENSKAAFIIEWDMKNGVFPTPKPTPTPTPEPTPEPELTPTPVPEPTVSAEEAKFHGIYYFLKPVKNFSELTATDKAGFYEELEPYRLYMNSFRIWTANVNTESAFCSSVADILEQKEDVMQYAEAYFGETVEITCAGFYDKENNFYGADEVMKITDVRGTVEHNEEIVFYPAYTVKVISTGEEHKFSPVLLTVRETGEKEDIREYAVMMETNLAATLPQLADVSLTWQNDAWENTESDSETVDSVLSWKYIGVNN